MTMLELMLRIFEQQGLVALLLFVTLVQNHYLQKEILNKNCQMNKFLMQCVDRELNHQTRKQQSHQVCPEESRFNDQHPGGTNIGYR